MSTDVRAIRLGGTARTSTPATSPSWAPARSGIPLPNPPPKDTRIVAVEMAKSEIAWAQLRDLTLAELFAAADEDLPNTFPRSLHPGGFQVLLADGSVHWFSARSRRGRLEESLTQESREFDAVAAPPAMESKGNPNCSGSGGNSGGSTTPARTARCLTAPGVRGVACLPGRFRLCLPRLAGRRGRNGQRAIAAAGEHVAGLTPPGLAAPFWSAAFIAAFGANKTAGLQARFRTTQRLRLREKAAMNRRTPKFASMPGGIARA